MSLYSNEQEIPVTCTPIFEGHLYVRTEKKEWKWRLFRFDGSTFTCLSTKKQPNSPTVNNPLYTTPKRLTDESIPNIKYFQLPEWTVDLSTICSISLLRKSKRPPKCFSIQTIFNKRYVLKASKQKDLERWLFVLTKMWTFTQQQQQQQQEPKVQPMLKPMLSREKVQVIEEWRRSLAELMAQDPNIKKTAAPPPIEPMPEDDNMSIFTDMTSISHRRPNKKVIKRQSTRRAKIMPKEIPLVTEANLILKKKGLDDAGLWMSNNLFNYFQQEKSEGLSSFDNNNNAVFVEKVKYYNFESGKKLIIQSQSNYLNYAKEEEEDEDISLAELLHKLNLTKQPPVKKCSSFVAPAIPPYKVSNYH